MSSYKQKTSMICRQFTHIQILNAKKYSYKVTMCHQLYTQIQMLKTGSSNVCVCVREREKEHQPVVTPGTSASSGCTSEQLCTIRGHKCKDGRPQNPPVVPDSLLEKADLESYTYGAEELEEERSGGRRGEGSGERDHTATSSTARPMSGSGAGERPPPMDGDEEACWRGHC